MAREREIRKIAKTTDKAIAQSASGAGRNAIEGDSIAPRKSEVDARHRRISEAAYRIAEARGFANGSELDDWLAAEREVDAADRDQLEPHSKAAAGPSSDTSGATRLGRPKESVSRQQTPPDQNSQTGSGELDETASRGSDAGAPVAKRAADTK